MLKRIGFFLVLLLSGLGIRAQKMDGLSITSIPHKVILGKYTKKFFCSRQ